MINSVTSLRYLSVWFDQHMTMSDHIGKVCSKAFFGFYNLRHIRKCLTDEACRTLVHALVVCHLEYCNALLHDVSQCQQQRVLNVAAWLIYRLPKYYYISPVLKDGAYYCYCAYVLRISRYSDFLSPVLTNTGIFLRGLKLSG